MNTARTGTQAESKRIEDDDEGEIGHLLSLLFPALDDQTATPNKLLA